MAQPADPALYHLPQARTVTVSGVGTVDVEPDEATVMFAVVTRAETAEDARRQNAEAAESAMDAVRALGIADRKIQLLSLRLDEEWDYQNNQRIRKGFIARRDVRVVIEDLDLVPDLVATVVQEGANELNGIQYGLQDRDAVEDQALQAAIVRAREKAQLMAEALGVGLGRVVQVAEGGVQFPQPPPVMFARAEMAMDQSESNPGAYAAGEIVVRATVTVTFELD
ncbi:MAG: SIMPL domain-containing protein [Rhodothermales bacterium]